MDEITPGRHRVIRSRTLRATARRMVDSKQRTPHFYASVEVEMDAVLGALGSHNDGRGPEARASVTAALIRALAITLQAHPNFNSVWAGDELEQVDAVNVAVAIDLPDGLIAPALLDCERLDLEGTARALRGLIARAREGRLRPRELTDATFTLSNLGMLAIDDFAAIIVPPQVAILATGRTTERPTVREGQVTVRRMMNATLSADHRAVDGAAAARFLADFRATLETSNARYGQTGPERQSSRAG